MVCLNSNWGSNDFTISACLRKIVVVDYNLRQILRHILINLKTHCPSCHLCTYGRHIYVDLLNKGTCSPPAIVKVELLLSLYYIFTFEFKSEILWVICTLEVKLLFPFVWKELLCILTPRKCKWPYVQDVFVTIMLQSILTETIKEEHKKQQTQINDACWSTWRFFSPEISIRW